MISRLVLQGRGREEVSAFFETALERFFSAESRAERVMLSRIILASTIVTVVLVVWLVARADGERVFYMDLGRPLDERDRARVRRVQGVTLASALVGVAAAAFAPLPAAVLVATLLPFVPIAWLLVEVVGAVKSAKPAEASLRFRVPLTEPPPAKQYDRCPWRSPTAR